MKLSDYAKGIAATIGAGAAAGVGIFAPHGIAWDVATILVAMAAVGGVVVGVTNTKSRPDAAVALDKLAADKAARQPVTPPAS